MLPLRTAVRIACITFVLSACGGTLTSEEHVAEARGYLEKSETDAAVIELKNALQLQPGNAEARWLIGQAYFDEGDFLAAEKELQKARQLGYSEDAVFPLLAQVLFVLQDFEELSGLSFADLSLDSKATVMAAQALALVAQGDLRRSKLMADAALHESPNSLYARLASARIRAGMGELELAAEEVSAIIELDESYTQGWALLGEIERIAGNYEAAEMAYSRAIEQRPQHWLNRLSRVLLYLQFNKYELVGNDLETLTKVAPRYPGVGYVQGLVLFEQKRFEAAISAFEIAKRSSQRFPYALFYLSISHRFLGQVEQAEQYAQRFHKLLPESGQGRTLLATIKLARGAFSEVEALLQPSMTSTSTDPVAMNILASALVEMGRIDEAIDILDKVVASQPESASARTRLGARLLEKGDTVAGIEQLHIALLNDPQFEQASSMLALYYVQQNDRDKALEVVAANIDANPENPAAYNLEGNIYLVIGEKSRAIEAFERARRLAPGQPLACHNLARLATQAQNYTQARDYYDEILLHHQDHLLALLQIAALDALEGNEEAMVAVLQRAIRAHPEAEQPRVVLASYYRVNGESQQALELLRLIAERADISPQVLLELGEIHLEREEFLSAEGVVTQAVNAGSSNVRAHFLLARAFAGQRQRAKVLAELDNVLKLDHEHFGALLARASIYLESRQFAKYEADMVRLQKSAPDLPAVLQLQADYAVVVGKDEYALDLLKQRAHGSPNTANVLAVANQQRAMGDLVGAAATLRQWAVMNPTDVQSRIALGNTYVAAKRPADAIIEFERALELQPDNPLLLNNLAWQIRHLDTARALELALLANAVQPQSAAVLDTLAMVQLAAGQLKQARRNIERALELSPADPSLKAHMMEIDSAQRASEAAGN